MTVPSTVSEKSYAGDGVTVAFPIPFAFDTSADIFVKHTDASGNIADFTSSYTVTGGGGSTGTATALTAPAVGITVTLYDDPEQSQETDYVDNDAFPASAHEGALDKLTRLIKRLSNRMGRTLRTADGDPITDLTLGSVDNRKGKYLFFNAITGAIEYAANVVTTALSQSIIGALLNPQTPGEAAAGVTPTNYWYAAYNVLRYGADRTGASASDTAFTNAVRAAEAGFNETVEVPEGTYRITGTVTIHGGVKLRGRGSSGSTPGGGASIMHESNGDCFVWDGNGTAFKGTGGGLMHVTIIKQTGFAGGRAVFVLATDDNHRPSEFMFQDVLIYGTGTGTWSIPFHIDGTACNTPGAKGVRDVGIFKLRVASGSTNFKYIYINQGVHVHGSYIQIDTANGTGTPGMTIEGDSTAVCLSAIEINGTVVIDGTATNINFQGHIANLTQNFVTCQGSFIGSLSGVLNNASKGFKVVSPLADAFAAKRTTDQSNITGDGTVVTVVYDAEIYDKAGSFDPATGIFIAKSAGLYQFNGIVTIGGLLVGHTSYEVDILHRDNGGSVQNTIGNIGNPFAMATPSGSASVHVSAQLDLAVGDSVRLQVSVTGSTKVVDVKGLSTTYTSFSGALL